VVADVKVETEGNEGAAEKSKEGDGKSPNTGLLAGIKLDEETTELRGGYIIKS